MATLTYDPTPADNPEFSEEEMDSLAIGERMAEDQQQLLAGKYQDAEELEKAYLELQGKLGQQEPDAEYEEEGEEEYEQGEETENEEYDDEDEDYQLTDQDVESIYEMVGGEEQYNAMINWAGDNLSEREVGMFDHVMDLGDPFAIFFAVRALSNTYNNATGVDGELLTGGEPAYDRADVFRSQAEVIEAMNDPKYDRDPAYRNDVFEKLDRSNIQF